MSQSSIQATTPPRPLRCLVIQLTRLGDTLQSLMALRAAKQLYPNLEIHFVVRERFSAAAKRVPWIEKVITLPTETLIGPVLTGQKTEAETLPEIARWLAPLAKEPWDMVVNWSYSEASSYLAGLLPARIKLGFTRRRDTTFTSTDGWSHYIQAIVQGGIEQNIHVTDILTTQLLTALQIHQGEPSNDGNVPVTSKSFFTLEQGRAGAAELGWTWKDQSRKWIGIQLGASHDSKTWEPESWGRFVALVLEQNPEYHVALMGGKEDLDRAKRVLAEVKARGVSTRNLVNLAGETTFDLWTSVVSRCQWVISGDTAALHLASVLGTRVLNVSVGPVRWSETGPYGNGHYVISSNVPCPGCESRNAAGAHRCREDVRAEAVYAAWSFAASQWSHRKINSLEAHFTSLGCGEMLGSVQVFKSRIRGTNDGGGVVYEPIIARPLEIKDWGSMVIGHIARAWYCGWVPPVGQGLARERMSPALIQRLRGLEESASVLSKICEEATGAANSLSQHGTKLKSDKIMRISDREELARIATKLKDLDALIDRLAKTEPGLLPFSQMSKVLMHNLGGTLLAELGRETAESYKQLSEGVAILREWIRHTIGLARPRPVLARAPRPLHEKELSPL